MTWLEARCREAGRGPGRARPHRRWSRYVVLPGSPLRRLPLWRQVAVQQVVAELAGRVVAAHQLPEVVQPRVLAAQDLRPDAEQLDPVRPGPQRPLAVLPLRMHRSD